MTNKLRLNLSCESNAFQGTLSEMSFRSGIASLNLSCESNAFQGVSLRTGKILSRLVLISLARVMLFRGSLSWFVGGDWKKS